MRKVAMLWNKEDLGIGIDRNSPRHGQSDAFDPTETLTLLSR
jgi:hypothetical protein